METNGSQQNLARYKMRFGARLSHHCALRRANQPTQAHRNDFAGVLDASSSESIRNICQQIAEKTKAQIAIVTIHSLDGADIESYASSL